MQATFPRPLCFSILLLFSHAHSRIHAFEEYPRLKILDATPLLVRYDENAMEKMLAAMHFY